MILMEKHAPDPLQRPSLTSSTASLPFASEVLMASAARRFAACIIDLLLVIMLVYWVALPLAAEFLPYEHRRISQLSILLFFLTWGTYATISNATILRATPGQMIMRIYVATLFGNTISPFASIGRFIIFSAPTLCMIVLGANEVLQILPPGFSSNATLDMTYSSLSELFYIIPVLVQFLMIWPMLRGNYSRVLWDRLFHTCVLRTNLRNLRSK